MAIIYTHNLSKIYRRFEKAEGVAGSLRSLFHRKMIPQQAVSAFDIEIEEGEFVGMIGPNGAGKTTLIKMLTGIIPPSGGDISVLGFYPNKLEAAYKQQYAVVMGQKSQLFFELTASDTFRLFQRLYNISESDFRKNRDMFVELFDVGRLLEVQVRTLSLGERMKMELIVALLHNPRILYLDEPTIGLDAVAQKQMRRFLREVNRLYNTTILLTSHYMEDIRSLCERCVVINHGQKIYDGAQNTLFERYQTHKRITVSFESEWRQSPPLGLQVTEQSPYRLCGLARREDVQPVLRELLAGDIRDIAIEEEEIGNVVERIYNETQIAEQVQHA